MADSFIHPSGQPVLLRLQGIHKSFGGIRALKGVSFTLQRGEIHALLGENGAGKSTLIKVLGGIHIPEAGEILIDGARAVIAGVADADRLGIRIIHQELSLVPNLSIAENIYLGCEQSRFGFLNRTRMIRQAEELIGRLGLTEIRQVRRPVTELSVAQQQLVEIARALSRQARILVLDEPTSALSEVEIEALFKTLADLRAQGVGIIYISHRLEEIIRLSDRITVLRDGETIGTQETRSVNKRQLIQWMVGRDITEHFHRPPHQPGEVVLDARELRNRQIQGVSFTLRQGEILGFAGLVGSGRSELARALYGIDSLAGGALWIHGRHGKVHSPGDALRAGLVMVPEDRKREGLVMTHSVAFNIALPWVCDWIRFCRPDLRRRGEIVRRAIEDYAIKVADPEVGMDTLSGGNQQKVLVGRWMEHRPRILILDEPTRGVDVGAREEIYKILGDLVRSGMAVMLISSDLEEVLGISHRVALYREGKILSIMSADQATPESVMESLTGVVAHENQ